MTPCLFNAASVSALLSTVVSLVGGIGASVLGRAPDWEDVRPLARVGLTAAVVSACNLPATLDLPASFIIWANRVQVLAIALHVAAWYAYVLQWGNPLPRGWRAAIFGPLLGAGALALVPGLVYGGAVSPRPVAWIGVTYRDPVLTGPGFAVFAVLALWALGGLVRLGMLRGRGVPFRRTMFGVTLVIFAMGVHDAVVIGGLAAPTPYLLDFGLYGPAVAIAVLTLRRVVLTATDLRRLRTGLEVAVVERTAELRAQAALAASERHAALRHFAAGIAREVAQPVRAAAAHLDALGRDLRDDPLDGVRGRLEDARAALGRIGALTRQLFVSGRSPEGLARPPVDVRIGRAAEAALAAARARAPTGVAFEAAVAPGLTVTGSEEEVVEVLTTLALHALANVPRGRPGAVRLRAAAAGDRVRISVEDDGPGLPEEALLHAFEPFHEGETVRGTGLALAVARGLVEGMAGTLRLESAPGRGTRALVELPRGAPDASAADLPGVPLAAPRRPRLLVVEGDLRALRAAVAELSAEHEIEAVSGLREALAALADRSFDLVLCDAALPRGGAERFWEELLLRDPALQGRVAFVVGGAESLAALAFLERQPQPVLEKPLSLAGVAAVVERLRHAAAPGTGGAGREPGRALAKLRPR